MRCPQALIYFVYIYIKFNDAVASMGQTDALVSVTFSIWGKSFHKFCKIRYLQKCGEEHLSRNVLVYKN